MTQSPFLPRRIYRNVTCVRLSDRLWSANVDIMFTFRAPTIPARRALKSR